MFGKVKNFALKKMLEKQLKNAPPEQREMLMGLLEKNPKLFEQMAKEMQEEMKKNGNNQMAAAMKVLPKYQTELLAAMSPEMRQKLAEQQLGHQGKFNPNGTIRK